MSVPRLLESDEFSPVPDAALEASSSGLSDSMMERALASKPLEKLLDSEMADYGSLC